MTQHREKQNASSSERSTQRGLGGVEARRDPRAASGAFPRTWPELSDSEPPPPAPASAGAGTTQRMPEPRPQSRGPEYHPPTLPGGGRERGASGGSGTFRVRSPAPVQVRAPSPPASGDGPSRAPTVAPAGPRNRRRAWAWPRLGTRRFLLSAGAGLALGSGVALVVLRVPVRAVGVLKAAGAPESLRAAAAGTVTELHAAAGAELEPGDAVLQIRSPQLSEELSSRRAELELSRRELLVQAREEDAIAARSLSALEQRRQLLRQRLELKDTELAQRKSLLEEITALVNAGSAQLTDLLEANAATRAAREARLGILDAMSQLELEVADRKSEQRARAMRRDAELARAEAQVRRAEAALAITTLRAPARGWLESLRVTAGSEVQAGAELARLVPRSPPRTVLALVAVADAAHVGVGDEAKVALSPADPDQTALAARVKHVSREVAPAARVASILGAPSRDGWVQLELELLDSPEYGARGPLLRTGSRAIVSFPTPERRLGWVLYSALRESLAFNP